MKRTILLAVMVCLGFVNSFFKPGSEKTREGNMKRKGLTVLMAAVLAVLGMGFGETHALEIVEYESHATELDKIVVTIKKGTSESSFDKDNTTVTFSDASSSDSCGITDNEITCSGVERHSLSDSETSKTINVEIKIDPSDDASPTYTGSYVYKAIPKAERVALLLLNTTSIGWDNAWPRGSEGDWNWLAVTESGDGVPHVTELDLSDKNIAGPVPDISGLTELTSLDLSQNQITSVDNAKLSSLMNLASVNLSQNRLASLPALPNSLTSLNASENQLASLPALPNSLTSLNASENQLASLPTLPSGLTSLDVSKNQLSQLTSLPASLSINGSNFSHNALHVTNSALRNSLNSADLGWEGTQTLPPTACATDTDSNPTDMDSITLELTPDSNGHTSGISGYEVTYAPTDASSSSEKFDTTDENTVIPVDSSSGQTLNACKEYRFTIRTFSDSHPSGSRIYSVSEIFTAKTLCIPYEEKQALTNLYSELGADGIWFEEPGSECNKPAEVVCESNSVTEINLPSQTPKLTEKIHSDVGNFPNLKTLDLSENEITGEIPTTMGSLGSLELLNLSGNDLSGGIPAELRSLSSLKELYLQENSNLDSAMKGIPSEIGNLSNLEYLYLYGGNLTDPIPPELGNLGNLIELDLSDNSLSGSIPKELENMGKLQTLDLSNNSLDGAIPAWKQNGLEELTRLSLNDNKLAGPIPDEIENLSKLKVIKVNGNMLSGNIPNGCASPLDLSLKESDFRWNALVPSGGIFDGIIDGIQIGSRSWIEYQTLTPFSLRPSNVTQTKISLNWSPRGNASDSGGYKIGFSSDSGGPYDHERIEFDGITKGFYNDIAVDSDTCYYIQVLARTDGHGDNDNVVYSIPLSSPDNELEICTPPSDTPVIGEIIPANGPSSGGNSVTIIGAHFISTTEVYFDDEKASTIYLSETKLTCTPPKYDPGKVDVKVTNPGAVPLSATCGECYIYDPPPDIISITPNFGYDIGGTQVTIKGNNFDDTNGVTVKFGGILAEEIVVVSATRITCKTPAYSSMGDLEFDQIDVEVINADNLSDKLPDGYTYIKLPNTIAITGISPNYGSAAGGQIVKINGSDFETGPSVTFNGTAATGVSITSTEITCTTPSNPSTPEGVDVVVENQAKYGGGKATCSKCYIYANAPEVKKVTPNNGSELTLTPITITGNYFDDSHLIFDKDEDTKGDEIAVTLSGTLSSEGNISCPSDDEGQNPCCLVVSSTEIKCLTSPLSVGQYDVIVNNEDGQTDRCYGCYSFNALPDPVVTFVEPNQGPIFGDTFVRIRGANFVDASKVTFAGKSAASVTFVSDTELTCRTPEYRFPDELVNVKVINPNSESEPCECYTYKDCTFEVKPNQGASAGGTEVTIKILENETETEFVEGTTVKFGNVEVTDVTFISSREILCKTPANEEDGVYKAGKVDVVVTKTSPGDQETTCLTAFTYTIIPEKERNALIALYEATDGENWRKNSGWKGPPGTECSWYGIKCQDGDTHVTKIDLPDNKLQNELPVPPENDSGETVSLGDLEFLESLILRGNSLEGPLPSVLLDTNLTKHRRSDFSDNKCLYAKEEDFSLFDRTQMEDGWEDDQHCKSSGILFMTDPSEPKVFEDEEKELKLKADISEGSGNEKPVGNVLIEFVSLNPTQCEVLTDSAILNREIWETGAPIRVKGVNDEIKDGTKNCTIFLTTSASAEDAGYDGLSSSITVVVKDASELAIHSVSPTLGTMDQELEVRITGNGFDKDPLFSIYPKEREDQKTDIPSEKIDIESDTELVLTIPKQSKGTYILKASNGKEGDELREDQQLIIFTDELSVEAQKRKRAIIVAGGKASSANSLWNATLNSANKAYLTLISQGYTADSIFYINPLADTDADGDGTEDVDGEATAAMLYYAINFWARGMEAPYDSGLPPVPEEAASEVLVYMTGHGRDSVFQIDGSKEEISAKTLDRWLDNLQYNVNLEEILNSWSDENIQSETGLKEDIDEWLEDNAGSEVLQDVLPEMSDKVIFIYDACMSGSFLPVLDAPKGKKRYVISSTEADERAWFLYDGDFSFSSHFWNSVYLNGKLYKAFEYGKQIMSIDQEAQIYGDPAVPTLEQDITIGIGAVAASVYPEIEVCQGFVQFTDSSLERLKEKLSEGDSDGTETEDAVSEDDSDTEPADTSSEDISGLLTQLETMKNQAYLSEEDFIEALSDILDESQNQYQSLILDSAEKIEVEGTSPLCTDATLCVNIADPGNGINFVLAQIIAHPDREWTEGSSDKPVVQDSDVEDLSVVKLEDTDGTRRIYTVQHKKFGKIGKYEASIHAVDKEGQYSVSKKADIAIEEAIRGDIDGTGSVDLRDAIVALKLSAGGEVLDTDVCVFADVDGSEDIGLADVIYILKQVAKNLKR